MPPTTARAAATAWHTSTSPKPSTNSACRDRTIAISPVGCAVFLYYYLDVGNTQAAHGRAPAVGLGHKLANPESIVVSYQGDGDLASIGLAEIIQAAQMGLPMTFVFINNAIYGMTGGQMAPTTLMGQQTTTSPDGRGRNAGLPLRMAEMIAGLDGPLYVERVALFDAKQRMRAKKAIFTALQLQVENRGLGFVEVLSECPTHLHMTPSEAEQWVKDKMLPIFPLGVFKDETCQPWFDTRRPNFDAHRLVEQIHASKEAPPQFGDGFPSHLDAEDVAIKFAGAGGDGAQMIAKLTAQCAINEGYDATYIPSYGPESRGGTSYGDVHIARREVLSPSASSPHVLVAFNAPSLAKFGPAVMPNGLILYDSTVIESHVVEQIDLAEGVQAVGVPLTGIAADLGERRVKNTVGLGALQALARLFPEQTFQSALERSAGGNSALTSLNQDAFRRGADESPIPDAGISVDARHTQGDPMGGTKGLRT